MTGNKTATAIVLFLMSAMTLTLVVVPTANAQEPDIIKNTFAIIGAIPNPVGVGQELLLHVGVTDFLVITWEGFDGLTVTVTRPDGTTETLGPYRTDATGGTGGLYVPSMVGTYTFQTHFPEQMKFWNPSSFAPGLVGNVLYKASDSEVLEVEVTTEPREYYPTMPLPTEYWTRPIDANLREWKVIAGSWPATPKNNYAPYNEDAPETAHILWTYELAMGGLVGGDLGEQSMECGAAYEQKGYPPIILNGKLFFNKWEETGGETATEQEVVAVDLHTGEVIWSRPLIDPNGISRRLDFGQLFYWDSYNYHGSFAYLWAQVGSTWHAFDAFTGRWVYTMENVTGGNNMYGPKGEIYKYIVDFDNKWMALWNSSRVVSDMGSWRPHGKILDAKRGIEWNVSIPEGLAFTEFYPYTAAVTDTFYGDRVIGTTAGGSQRIGHEPITTWSLSTKPGSEGQRLFQTEWTPPQADTTISYLTGSLEDGIYVLRCKETRQYWGFDINTGQKVWGPTDPEHYLGIYGTSSAVANGKLYSVYMAGIVYCYDIKTGALEWTYDALDVYTEILWGNNWPLRIICVADGKLYLYHGEHSPVDPKPRGGPILCLDAETGERIWELDSMYFYYRSSVVMGDSIIVLLDSYDQRFYAFGKGPTATTVTAPDVSTELGKSVVIRGMVADISPGTDAIRSVKRFPNGVPAVSDESISEWMQYVYQQFPRPSNATGVSVTIDVMDANGNYRNIGETTSNADGFFSFDWQPDIPGKYTVIATFAGSKAYYGSHAYTAFVVDEPMSTATPEPTQAPASMADLYFMPVSVGMIVAIAAVLVMMMLLFRRK